MDRFEFEDLISAYIENDLPLNKRKDFEDYLVENPSQNQVVKQIATNMKALKKLPKIKFIIHTAAISQSVLTII